MEIGVEKGRTSLAARMGVTATTHGPLMMSLAGSQKITSVDACLNSALLKATPMTQSPAIAIQRALVMDAATA